MEPERIRKAVAGVMAHFEAHPEEALSEDKPAKAVLESGLRIRVEGPGSWSMTTDMPAPFGGEGSAPSPGWLRRAAQAACEATMIAIGAAQSGIALQSLEVTIGSVSDDRGMLGVAEGVPAGPDVSSSQPGAPLPRGSARSSNGQSGIPLSQTHCVVQYPTSSTSRWPDLPIPNRLPGVLSNRPAERLGRALPACFAADPAKGLWFRRVTGLPWPGGASRGRQTAPQE